MWLTDYIVHISFATLRVLCFNLRKLHYIICKWFRLISKPFVHLTVFNGNLIVSYLIPFHPIRRHDWIDRLFFHPLSLYSLWEVCVVFTAFYLIHACVCLFVRARICLVFIYIRFKVIIFGIQKSRFSFLFILSVCSLENGNLSSHLQTTLRRPWRLACRHKQFSVWHIVE